MSRTGHLRASDADRDQVAERLRTAAAEGRIATDELDERMGATLAARTYAELDVVTADLPVPHPARQRSPIPALSVARVAIALAIVVPVMMAMLFVLTGVLAGWMVWAVAGWWFFGHHHHHQRYYRYGGPRHAHRQPGAGYRRAEAGPGRGFRV
jgi:hypothetical protein